MPTLQVDNRRRVLTASLVLALVLAGATFGVRLLG